jgi:hypothetical protein
MNVNPELGDGWWIRHPGTLEWTRCDSFLAAMDRWFEGFNPPRLVMDGAMDTFEGAYERVSHYYAGESGIDLFTNAEPEYII